MAGLLGSWAVFVGRLSRTERVVQFVCVQIENILSQDCRMSETAVHKISWPHSLQLSYKQAWQPSVADRYSEKNLQDAKTADNKLYY